ncbi:MAG: hypothetical protein IIA88_03165 [Bacteroidetes bacterium]|nr:hypothetical protein [Bacteroidota bacterium]
MKKFITILFSILLCLSILVSCNKYCSTSPSGRNINAYKDLKTETGNSTKDKGNNEQNKKVNRTIKLKHPVKIKRQYYK